MAASQLDGQPGPPSDRTYLAKCVTCGVARRFYTVQGANGFRLDHTDHDVSVEGAPEAAEPKPAEYRGEPRPEYPANGEKVGAQADSVVRPEPQGMVEPREPEKAVPVTVGGRVETAGRPAVARTNLEEEPESLLLAGSFYLQDDEEVEKEASRVSRALRELNRGGDPPYLISVMIGDDIGIEASGEAISTDVVAKMGNIGYRFVAMNAPKGKPTSWFKRSRTRVEAGAGSAEPVSPNASELTRELEALKKQLEAERSRFQQEKEAWKETEPALLKQLKKVLASSEKRSEETPKASCSKGQTWAALNKAWKAYKISEVRGDQAGMSKYAGRIRTLQKELGLLQTRFPNLGVA